MILLLAISTIAWPATNPFPIGAVTITAGTPINLGVSLVAASVPVNVKALILYNSGSSLMYLGSSTSMTKATLAGVIAVIQPGERFVIGGASQTDNIAWGAFWVDGDTNGDVLLVSGQTVS